MTVFPIGPAFAAEGDPTLTLEAPDLIWQAPSFRDPFTITVDNPATGSEFTGNVLFTVGVNPSELVGTVSVDGGTEQRADFEVLADGAVAALWPLPFTLAPGESTSVELVLNYLPMLPPGLDELHGTGIVAVVNSGTGEITGNYPDTQVSWSSPVGPPGPPTNVAVSKSGNSVTVTWGPPDVGKPVGYLVDYDGERLEVGPDVFSATIAVPPPSPNGCDDTPPTARVSAQYPDGFVVSAWNGAFTSAGCLPWPTEDPPNKQELADSGAPRVEQTALAALALIVTGGLFVAFGRRQNSGSVSRA